MAANSDPRTHVSAVRFSAPARDIRILETRFSLDTENQMTEALQHIRPQPTPPDWIAAYFDYHGA